jgi:hypothetical protein
MDTASAFSSRYKPVWILENNMRAGKLVLPAHLCFYLKADTKQSEHC